MSPLQFAQQECANYDSGRCLGADVWTTTVRPLKVCLLHESKPCRYFEACVLPLANRGNMQLVEARRSYELSHGISATLPPSAKSKKRPQNAKCRAVDAPGGVG